MLALAVTVITLVVDATRSIAAGRLVATPLIESWQAVSPDTLSALRTLIQAGVHPSVWDGIAAYVLGLPGFAIFAVLALLFAFLGRRPEKRVGRFALET